MAKPERIIYEEQTKLRLDKYLVARFSDRQLSRSYWTNMIQHGHVLLNQTRPKAGVSLKSGDELTISWPEITDLYSDKIEILHEDDSIIVINKPAGVLSHSKGDFNPEYTVADFFKSRLNNEQAEGLDRNGIVHRLDRQTSGVMIGAKTLKSQKTLQAQFANRQTDKFYIALTKTGFKTPEVNVDLPIARNPANPKTFKVDKAGKAAQTNVLVIREDESRAVVLLHPTTGRTHQLRVHLSHLGHPIIGDQFYGSDQSVDNKRFLLHAYQLLLKHPDTDSPASFVAPIASDMASYIQDEDKTAIDQRIVASSPR